MKVRNISFLINLIIDGRVWYNFVPEVEVNLYHDFAVHCGYNYNYTIWQMEIFNSVKQEIFVTESNKKVDKFLFQKILYFEVIYRKFLKQIDFSIK